MSDHDDLSPIEARLRDAIGARTGRDNVMTDDRSSLDAIEARLAAAHRSQRNHRIILAAAAVVVVAAAVVSIVLVTQDDGNKVATENTTTTTTEQTTTSTSTSTVAAPVKAVWPFEANGVQFSSAEEAALSFATDYLGMTKAVTEPAQTGAETTTVDVHPRPNAGATIHVELTQKDGGWVVLGAAADSIKVDTPATGDDVTAPLHVAGQSTAFEAQINLEIREFGSTQPLASGYTNGGANGEMGPFDTTLDVPTGLTEGVLVVYEPDASGEGAMTAATVIRLGVSARGENAGPEPDRIYAWKTDGTMTTIDSAGTTEPYLAAETPDGEVAVGGDKVAITALDHVQTCAQNIELRTESPATSTFFAGTHPALSVTGDLAYVDCDGKVVFGGSPHTATNVVGLTWGGDNVVVAHDSTFEILGQPGTWTGTLPAGRGRYGTIAFLDTDGTISSVDPASPSKAPVPLVTPAAKPVSLDADDSGAHLLWVDTNGDLWKWSGGDPVKIGSGFTTAGW